VTTAVIVEDDVLASMALVQLLEGEGYSVRSFACTDEAYARCINEVPDVLIADWCVPGGMSTADLALALRQARADMKIIFISGYESNELRGMAQSLRGAECISKPIQFERFLSDIRSESNSPAL
jgi:two-component system cell cycle response regulator CpdR